VAITLVSIKRSITVIIDYLLDYNRCMQHYEPRLFSDDGLFPMPAAQRSVLYRRLAELLYRKSQQIKTLLFTASFEDD